MPAIGSDFTEADFRHERAAGRVLGEYARQQFPESRRLGCFEQRCHRNAARTRATAMARNIDREFRDAGVARAGAVGGGGSEGHDLPPRFDHHNRMPAVEPSLDLLRASRLGLEGADAIGDALVVNPGNGRGVRQRRGARRERHARLGPRSYQPRVRRTMRTTVSMTGTSTSTPTTVASAAPD